MALTARPYTLPVLARGLSSAQAAGRLAADGPNVLPSAPAVRLWQRVAAQLRDPLMLVLMAATALTTGTGDWADASVILLVIVANTSTGVIQEVKAGRAITALSMASAPEARVLRDGLQRMIPAADVVAGDVLVLAEGDIVAADARVTEAAALLLDESALTGESVPAGKVPGDGPDGLVSAGTVIVRGRGRAVVTATGEASAMGRIAALMRPRPALTPLQRRMAGVGRVLAVVAVLLCAIVLALGLGRGQQAELMIVTAISLVVAAVPESLPAVVTLALALGARRMTARRALVRRLPAVETLGSVTVIGTDKTGTLTEGVMVARRLWTPAGEAVITGSGYRPRGQVLRDGRQCGPAEALDVIALLTAAALCNDAVLLPPQDAQQEWTAVGDPTEAALLAAAGKSGQRLDRLRAETRRVAEIPFDSVRKRMTTAHRRGDGELRVICKGAPEVVLTSPLLADSAELVALARNHAEALARDGFRVLAVAAASRPAGSTPVTIAADAEQGLRLLGLIGLVDPPRRSAATGRPWQSMAFFALGATQLAVALGSRARPGTLANPMLPVAVAVALGLQLAGLYLPPLRDLLHTAPLTWTDLVVVSGLAVLGYVAARLDRLASARP